MEQSQTRKNSALPILIAIVVATIILGGCVGNEEKNQEDASSVDTPEIEEDSEIPTDTSGTTYEGDIYQITYQEGWTHEENYGGDHFYKKNADKYPSLVIAEPPTATDQGMCLKQQSEKTLTTENGLSFTLTFNANDKENEPCKDAFDHDFIQVFIENPLNKWMYFTYLPEDKPAERELEDLLQSIKVKN